MRITANVNFSKTFLPFFVFGLLLSSSLSAQTPPRGPANAQVIRNWNTRILQLQERLANSPALARVALRLEASPVFQQRLAALAELAEKDPQSVLDSAFSNPMLKSLADDFPGAELEEEGEFTGVAEHIVADDETLTHGTSHIRMRRGNEWLKVNFTGKAPDILCSDTLKVRGVRVGSTVAAADGVTSNAPGPISTCATTGTQYIAVLLVTFPGVTPPANVTPDIVNKIFFQPTGRSVDGFWKEASQGKASASGKVFGWYTLDAAYSCTQYYQMRDAAIRAADKDVDFRTFNRVMLVFPPPTGCGWAGLGTLGCSYLSSAGDGNFTASSAWLVSTYMGDIDNGVKLATHEGGHNLGLHHARTYDFGSEALGAIGATPSITEYGDVFSTMGSWNFGHYSAPNKVRLKWFDTTTQAPTVTTGGVYDLIPFASSTPGRQALKIQRGAGNNSWLWLEYRQPLGIYESTLSSQIFSGASIRYEEGTTSYSNLLDFTPETASWSDPALAVGKTWSDPYSNLSIQVQSATANGLAVNISYGATPCVRNAPTLTISPANPSGNAGSKLDYTVTVANNDTSGCAASTFAPNSTAPSGWTTTYSTSGLTVNPGASGSFTMSKTIPNGTSPATYAANVSISDANHATQSVNASATVTAACVRGVPTLTLTPSNPSGAPGASLNYTVNVVNTDSSSCASSTFAPSSTLPAGWTTTYSTSGLTLAPGANGNITMTKVVPNGTAANTYQVNFTVSDANHNQSATASATVTSACTYAPPTVSVSPNSQSGAPGTQLTYTVTVVNKDSASCAAARLAPSTSAPTGWPNTFSTSLLTLAPGATGEFTMTKTIPAGTAAKTYSVAVNVSDNNHNQGAGGSAVVTSSSCTRAAPTLTVTPSSLSGAPGALLTYTVTVVNKDSSSCAAASFAPSSTAPTGWTTTYSTSSLSLAPGATGNFTMTKTIPAAAAPQTYAVSVNVSDPNHNQGASASAVVTNSCTYAAPTVSVSPSSQSGSPGAQLTYTVTVVNKDSASCAAASFVPSSAAPSGWATSYSKSSLTLAPGATGNFTMTKTIPAAAAASTYAVGVNVSDANHNQGASASATVTNACAYAAPTVVVSPSSQSGAPGAQLTYTVTVTNRDTAACAAARFVPSTSAPSGWSTAFSTSLLTLAPGATGNFTMTKTIPAGTAANTYAVAVNVSDNNHNQGASASATVTASSSSTPTACTYAAPTVTVSPASQSGAPGAQLNYTVTVTNRDTASCAAARFVPSTSAPSGWSTAFSTSLLTLAPGATGNFTMTKTIPAAAAAGSYAVAVNVSDNNHNQGASASATVTAVSSGLKISLALPGGAFALDDSVTLTATVTNGSTPVSGAMVGFTVRQPNGSTSVTVAYTNASGVATRVLYTTQAGAWSATASTAVSSSSATSNSVNWTAN